MLQEFKKDKSLRKDKYIQRRFKNLKDCKDNDEIMYLLNSIYLDGLEDGRNEID